MGETRNWGQLAEQHTHDIRREFLEQRTRVRPEGWARHIHAQVGRTHWVPRDWYRGFTRTEQSVVLGAAVSAESRKAVLIGKWAAAQFGMWALPPESPEVWCGLPSGNVPSRSNRPYTAHFHSMQIAEDDVVELDGVRATHPLRTFVDFFRLNDAPSGYMARSWLTNAGVAPEEILDYIDGFSGPIRPRCLKNARTVAEHGPEFSSYAYSLAWALLCTAGLPVRAHVDIEGMWRAKILVGKDLILLIGIDPLSRDLAADHPNAAQTQRKRLRWLAGRGYRVLYFTLDEIKRDPDGFTSEVYGAQSLRLPSLVYPTA